MKNAPNSNNQPDSTPETQPNETGNPKSANQRFWLLLLGRSGLALAVLFLLGLAGGAWYAWTFIHKGLAPMVENTIYRMSDRQVKLGRVESFSLNSLRFGKSSLLATPGDRDNASVEAVNVTFNLLPVLFTRRLGLNITLIQPEVYIEEEAPRQWVNIAFNPLPPGPIAFEVERVRVNDATVVLVPYGTPRPAAENRAVPTPANLEATVVSFSSINATANLSDGQKRIAFDVSGRQTNGGEFSAGGDLRIDPFQGDVELRSRALSLAPLSRLISGLPATVISGEAASNIEISIEPDQPISLNGVANFSNLAASSNLGEEFLPNPPEITNTRGTLRFDGQLVGIENVSTLYGGQIPITAAGLVDLANNLEISVELAPVTLEKIIETTGVEVPIDVTGEIEADVMVRGSLEKPAIVGTISTTKPAQIDKVAFEDGSVRFELVENTLNLKDITVNPQVGGQITAAGEVSLGENQGIALDVAAKDVPADAIAQLYGIEPTDLTLGTLSASGQLFGPFNNLQALISSDIGGGTVEAGARIANGNLQAEAVATQVRIHTLSPRVPPELQTAANGVLQLAIPLNSLNLNSLQAAGRGWLELASGTVNAVGQLANSQWQSVVQADRIQLGELSPLVPPSLDVPFAGTFEISGSLDALTPETIRASGRGSLPLAGGTVNVLGGLETGVWQVSLQGDRLDLGQLSPQVPPGLRSPVAGVVRLQGTLADLSAETVQAVGRGRLNVGGGSVRAIGNLDRGNWTASLEANQVQLDRLGLENSSFIRGVSGSTVVQLSGNLDSFTNCADSQLVPCLASEIQGGGQAFLSRVPVLERGPLSATFAWDGTLLQIPAVQAPDLVATGFVAPDFEDLQTSQFDLNLQLADVNLPQVATTVESLVPNFQLPIPIRGRVDFVGRVAGTLLVPGAEGQLQLRDLAVNEIAFDPVLAGPVRARLGRGVAADLAGTQDRIGLVLDDRYLPQWFVVQLGDAIATGREREEILEIAVRDFPLAILNFQPPQFPGIVSGKFSGNVDVNLDNCMAQLGRIDPDSSAGDICAVGEVAIAQPGLGYLKANLLEAEFSFASDVAILKAARLRLGEGDYRATGSVDLDARDPQFQGEVDIEGGNPQDILKVLQWFEFADIARGLQPPVYGDATDLRTLPASLKEESLQTQLRRFSEITQFIEERDRLRAAQPIPPLAELDGSFDGNITLAGSVQSGINVDFNISGQDWSWRDYKFNPIIVNGRLADGVLSVLPVRIVATGLEARGLFDERQEPETLLTFQGEGIGGEGQSGQLRVENIPVSLLKRFVELPIDLTGSVDATATLLGGTLTNPQVVGKVTLVEGTVNQTAVESATGAFSLSDGRLNFGSTVLVSGSNPMQVNGSIPSPLPVGSVSPITREIELDVNLENEGLALLNVLSRQQVQWLNGKGSVNLQVGGTLTQPIATGEATVEDATFAALLLPEPLTDVNGVVRFEGDRLFVEEVKGNFSSGRVAVAGMLPLVNPIDGNNSIDCTVLLNRQIPQEAIPSVVPERLTIENRNLTVCLDQLALNLKGIYRGRVNGNVAIAGATLSPVIGGEINLSQGKVLLSAAAQNPGASSGGQNNAGGIIPEFDNLQIALGDRIDITLPPLLEFRAAGDLRVNGTLDDLRPAGTIALQRGYVNLFTTQFRLANDYSNTAEFLPSQGLDPYLDVQLETAVSEIGGTRQLILTPSDFPSSEIDDAPFLGGRESQTIRIEATVNGPASELTDNLELTSSPTRSESEIVALLGGGFVETLGRGNGTLALANLAGNALFSSFQNQIGDAIGLSEFRLFPVVDFNQQTGTSTLDFGTEFSLNITDNLSASLWKILTNQQPPRFSLRYYLNERIILRGSTNFSDDNRTQIEYETRF